MSTSLLPFFFLALLPGLASATGCMNFVCGANRDTKLQDCDPASDQLCGRFKGRRSNNAFLEAIDINCPVKEAIFAPITGTISYVMPFGGSKKHACADQAARIDGTGQWQGYHVIITTVVLSKYGGSVSAGEVIGHAGNVECALEGPQQSNTNYVQLQLFREGKPVDPTPFFVNCLCTGQICETNHNNQLIGGFKSDSRFNGVKGFEVVCTLAEEESDTTDAIETRAPIVYAPIEGHTLGRKRLRYNDAAQRYEGCDNEGLFIIGTGKWTDFDVTLYNVRYREDLGFGKKRIQQGQPIGYRLTCPKAPNSVFVEVRFQGTIVNVTDLITANNCKAPEFGILY